MINGETKKSPPLVELMTTIYDCQMDIKLITERMRGNPWGNMHPDKKVLNAIAKRLNDVYDQLREVTGLHPCK